MKEFLHALGAMMLAFGAAKLVLAAYRKRREDANGHG